MESTHHIPLSKSTNDSFSTSSQCSLSPVKKENSCSINNFFQMVKKINKLQKYVNYVERESELVYKIKKKQKIVEDPNLEIAKSCLFSHRNCLLDFCLTELFNIRNEFKIIHELDSSRLLFLKRKFLKAKTHVYKIIAKSKLINSI